MTQTLAPRTKLRRDGRSTWLIRQPPALAGRPTDRPMHPSYAPMYTPQSAARSRSTRSSAVSMPAAAGLMRRMQRVLWSNAWRMWER